jgi:Protein of unknown function (DUF3017)
VSAHGAPRRRVDPLAVVTVAVAVGVVFAAVHHPRIGTWVACGGMTAAAVLRLVLSPRNAGSLVIRKRRIDVLVLSSLAIALGVLAVVTPFTGGHSG